MAKPGDPSAKAAAALPEAVYQKSLDCVHCGVCLSSCPTYLATGRENSSPRGRIYLMRGVAEGRIPLGEVVAEEAFLCVGCRACETACPSGVEFGSMLELTRDAVDAAGLRDGPAWRRDCGSIGRYCPSSPSPCAKPTPSCPPFQRLANAGRSPKSRPRAVKDAAGSPSSSAA